MDVKIESFYTDTLPTGGDHLTAITEVSATGGQGMASQQVLELIYIIDRSGSMDGPGILAVKRAMNAVLPLLDERTVFGVVLFNNTAEVLVPPQPATATAKAAAAERLAAVHGAGGTCMSTGLQLAAQLFGQRPDAIHQAVFLTDGENDNADTHRVEQVLRTIGADDRSRYQCDVWGFGTAWQTGEGQQIASTLLGKASIIPGPDQVEAAFRASLEKAQSKAARNARLRLTLLPGVSVARLQQVNPMIEDLTARGAAGGEPNTLEYPLGAWGGDETREYQVDLRVPTGEPGPRRRVARISFVYTDAGGQDVVAADPKGAVIIAFTDDEALSTRINERVAHYTGQAEKAEAIKEGLEARAAGDYATATIKLGRAVQLAAESDDRDTTSRLSKLVDIQDAATGTVRVRPAQTGDQAVRAAEMDLELERTSTVTVRRKPRDADA